MIKKLIIKKKINPFDKVINVEGDKSISIRWVLLSSLSKNKSIAYNLLKSEDVINAIKCIKKLGSKVIIKKSYTEIIGTGLKYKEKNNLILDAGNSGTLARLILGLLVNYEKKIKLIGDKSLSKRDFSRVVDPLKKFGVKAKMTNNSLPIYLRGVSKPKSIKYFEKKGSAQCKSSIMLASLKSEGTTIIKAKKSRNHTELMFKNLKIPIKIITSKNLDFIELKKTKKIKPLNYQIPGDISSSAFFIVLTLLSKNSKLQIKNVNINPSRIGVIKILNNMGASIKIKNKRKYYGEQIADIIVKSAKKLNGYICPKKLNSSAIDEFLIIFLVAAKSKGVSYFSGLSELNQKESPRLIWGSKILTSMGIRNISTKDSIKIYGNPNIKIDKKIIIKNYLKDHRVFMTSVIAALTFGGSWTIRDPESIDTSFPSFLNIIKKIKN